MLHELDEGALVQDSDRTKERAGQQYQKKFDFDNVKLRFTDDSLKAVAGQAVERKVGARGLMMILEELLLRSDVHAAVAKARQGICYHQRDGRAPTRHAGRRSRRC